MLISKKLHQSWILIIAMLAVSATILTACGGETKEVTPSPSPTPEIVAQPTENSEPPIEEIQAAAISDEHKELLDKILGNASSLESFSTAVVVNQKMEATGSTRASEMKMTFETVLKPEISFYQMLEIDMAGEKQIIESYFTPEGFYMKEPASDEWMIFTQDIADELMEDLVGDSMDPFAELTVLAEYEDQLQFEEKDDLYIIRLKASGDEFKDLVSSTLADAGVAGTDVELNEREYYIEVDKATYFPLVVNINFDMNLDTGGGIVKMVQDTSAVYSKHNSINAIVVPEEALNAISMDGL